MKTLEEKIREQRNKLKKCPESDCGKYLSNIAILLLESNPVKSKKYSETALENAVKFKDKLGQAICLQLIGLSYYYQTNFLKGLEYLNKALLLAEKVENAKLVSSILNNQGIIYDNLGNYQRALDVYLRSLEIDRKNADQQYVAHSLLNIGELYHRKGNQLKAIEYFKESLSYYRECTDNDGISLALNNLLITSVLAQEEEILYLNELENRVDKIIKIDIKIMAYGTIALIYSKFSQYDKALLFINVCIELSNSQGSAFLIFSNRLKRVEIFLKDNMGYDVYEELMEIEKFLPEINSDFAKMGFIKVLIEYFVSKGNYIEAYHKQNEYHELSKKIFNEQELQRNLELESRIEIERQLLRNHGLEKINKTLDRLNNKLKKKNDKITNTYDTIQKISELGQKITSSLDSKTILRILYDSISSLIKCDYISVALLKDSLLTVDTFAAKTHTNSDFEINPEISTSISALVLKYRKSVIINNFDEYCSERNLNKSSFTDANNMHSCVFIPLKTVNRIVGVFSVQAFRKRAFSQNKVTMLEAISSYLAIALENSNAYKQLNDNQRQIIELERKNAVLAMAVTANHEINQPLMVVQGNMELLEYEIGEEYINPKVRKYLNDMNDSIKRISHILNKYKKIDKFSITNYSSLAKKINITED
ncbi:MAG: tetratricopeptide repeat protein [Candidatus Cloacimonetes bacterium]|nr:tetratricopeptide repeat protein [Candidatus Cloacimonadota bacterium]